MSAQSFHSSPLSLQSYDDVQLLKLISGGDEAAMLLLYDRYSQLSYSVCLGVVRDASVAEELMHDLFFQLWRKPCCFNPDRGKLAPWIAVSSRHRAIDYLRAHREISVDIADMQIPVAANQEQSSIADEVFGKIRSLMLQMKVEDQLVFRLSFFDGLTHSEICEKTGQPLGTVKSRLRTIIIRLRKSLSK